MIGFLEGLVVTLKTTLRRPVTAQYPDPNERIQVATRFMGFPALTWDAEVEEPYCTGCMVCIRDCPTQCMSAKMTDNPQFAEGKSRRRKIIEEFEINLGRCILCGICVDVCNFDAIEMSHGHELSKYERNANRVDLSQLLEMGKEHQAEVDWEPRQPEKNSGVPLKKDVVDTEPAQAVTGDAPTKEMSKEDRLAAARARAQAKGQAAPTTSEPPAQAMSKEDRLAAARATAQAKGQAAPTAAGEPPAQATSKEERLEAARARAQAKGQAAPTAAGESPEQATSKEERLAAARARAQAKREAAASTSDGGESPPGTPQDDDGVC